MKCTLTIAELEAKYHSGHIPYAELLQTEDWKITRQRIVNRDGCRCKKCGKAKTERIDGGDIWVEWVTEKDSYIDSSLKELGWTAEDVTVEIDVEEFRVTDAEKPYHLEVHHKYYIAKTYPWQYPDDALITLCNWCHQNVHDSTVVPFYNDKGQLLGYTPCQRCKGSGSFPEYNHVQSGMCFRCGGARYEELIEKQEKQ